MGRRREEGQLTNDYGRQRVAVPSLLPRRRFKAPRNFLHDTAQRREPT